MSYESYKVIHLAAIFVFLSGAAVLLLAPTKGAYWKAVTGVASLLILVTGMGLLHKMGLGFPPWVQGLIAIWLILSMLGHIVAKRFPAQGAKAYWATIALAIVGAALAVYKPF
ncbi:MAG: hypothetical protein ACXVB9_19150 [Bdellovibrionota bacterium]